jgi:hypothetical protein
MAGEFDIIKRGHTAKRAKAIPGSQKIIVNGRDTYCANDKPDVVKRLFFNFLERVAECLKAMHLQMNCSGNCIEGYPVSTPGCCARIALRANLSQGKGTTTWLNHAPQ